jgi:sugar lactone lactonase YvrE
VVTTLVGSVGTSGSIDGTGSAACFNVPSGITTDGKNLFISDSYNHTIRKVVIATGTVTTLAGTAGASGSTDGTGSVAKFSYPWGITTDGTNVFVADSNNHSIRQVVIATGVVTTLAGTAGTSGSIDGIGSGAFFNVPVGTTTDGVNVYVTDSNNHTIRQVVIATGAVTTLAGTAGTSGSTDGIGSGAFFNVPVGITTDGKNLYVADLNNHTIRKVVIATGTVTTQEPNPLFISSPPIGLTTDGTKLYVTISANNTIHVIE